MPLDASKQHRVETWRLEVALLAGPPPSPPAPGVFPPFSSTSSSGSSASSFSSRRMSLQSMQRLFSRVLKTKFLGNGRLIGGGGVGRHGFRGGDDEDGDRAFCTAMYTVVAEPGGDAAALEKTAVGVMDLGLIWEKDRLVLGAENVIADGAGAKMRGAKGVSAAAKKARGEQVEIASHDSRSSKLAARRERLERAARLLKAGRARGD